MILISNLEIYLSGKVLNERMEGINLKFLQSVFNLYFYDLFRKLQNQIRTIFLDK